MHCITREMSRGHKQACLVTGKENSAQEKSSRHVLSRQDARLGRLEGPYPDERRKEDGHPTCTCGQSRQGATQEAGAGGESRLPGTLLY